MIRTIVFATLALASAALAAEPKTIKVNPDGTGDFKTVQAAIDSIAPGDATIVELAPATYKERIEIPKDKPHLTLRGTDAKTTTLTWDWSANHEVDGKKVGTFGSYSTLVAADDFTAENLTFENTAGETGQALALAATGDRQVYRNCRLLGWQDTLYANGGRQYYEGCYIEGRVDFIFGNATAVFKDCTIHSKGGGYVTASSAVESQPYGYVFLDCKLTGDMISWDPASTNPATTQQARKPTKALLGRPWRPYAMVAFIRCEIGDHLNPLGWDNWRKVENEQTARFYEYGNTGPGADRAGRVPWARELTKEEAEKLTPQKILAGSDGWDPTAAH